MKEKEKKAICFNICSAIILVIYTCTFFLEAINSKIFFMNVLAIVGMVVILVFILVENYLMLFKGIIKKRLKKEKNFKTKKEKNNKIKNVLNILKGIFSSLIKKRKSDTEESTSNTTSKQHDIEYSLEEIRKNYEGIDWRYAIISFGGIRISDLLHQTVSHGVLFIEQAEALNELIDMSLSGYAHTECTIALINFKNVFCKNILKIAGLAEFFYNYRDYFEDQNLQDSLKKAAKILNELVSTNAQILTTVSDMYVSLNTSNSNDTEIIDFFTKRSKELLEVLNNKTS